MTKFCSQCKKNKGILCVMKELVTEWKCSVCGWAEAKASWDNPYLAPKYHFNFNHKDYHYNKKDYISMQELQQLPEMPPDLFDLYKYVNNLIAQMMQQSSSITSPFGRNLNTPSPYDKKLNYACPSCGHNMQHMYSYQKAGYQNAFVCNNGYQLPHCMYYMNRKRFTQQELLGGTVEVKQIQVCKVYNDTIVEIKFIMFPRKGWFAENVTPMINIIKVLIPATQREYDTNTTKWSVAAEYWPALESVFKQTNWTINWVATKSDSNIPNVNVPKEYAKNFHYKQEVVTTQESATSIAEKLSEFLGVKIVAQDLNDLKKLYRAKARELHPDMGGDASKMSELNRLWTLYCDTGARQ